MTKLPSNNKEIFKALTGTWKILRKTDKYLPNITPEVKNGIAQFTQLSENSILCKETVKFGAQNWKSVNEYLFVLSENSILKYYFGTGKKRTDLPLNESHPNAVKMSNLDFTLLDIYPYSVSTGYFKDTSESYDFVQTFKSESDFSISCHITNLNPKPNVFSKVTEINTKYIRLDSPEEITEELELLGAKDEQL